MTERVTGYRTLAQLGAASPVPAHVRGYEPASTDAGEPTLPPVPVVTPQWTPIGGPPQAAVPSIGTTSGGMPYSFDPDAPARIEAGTQDARTGANPTGGWHLPFVPLTLPNPVRMLSEGGRQLWEFHPGDPNYRLTGRHQQTPAPDGAVAPKPADGAKPDESNNEGGERSQFAKTAMMVGIGGGFLMNAVDIVRTVKKYPEALRAARFDPSLGRLGRMPTALALTAMTRPDARLIDPALAGKGPASIATLGKTFDKFDEIAMKSSVLLGTSLAALQLASAIPNLTDALSKDGPWYENIALSTSGRAGVLQLAGGGLGLGLFLKALHETRATAGTGVVNKMMAAAKAPIMAKPIFTSIGIGSGMLVMANELGYLDFLNTGEDRSTPTVLKEAAQKTPVLNDQEFRTAALLGAGGVIGYKATRAIQAGGGLFGGGLANLGKGHIIGGALVAGLLGAQLLGGLDILNKPDTPDAEEPAKTTPPTGTPVPASTWTSPAS